MTSIDSRISALDIVLPTPPAPAGSYVPYVLSGNLLFVAGQGAKDERGNWYRGQVGSEISKEQAYERARLTGSVLLAVARMALGSLDRVSRVVKILGFVNCTNDFTEHPAVINGCSDLLVAVFGECGQHARSAVGVASLPMGLSVEIEAIFEVR
jgi:enamine deaminase RidA (YjgF/YER057c/UK114 family)